ncbi:MAG TPA: PH domain-containing protein [Thermoplasmata archaeon]|nr:PH domain-containing protein [Thermoplasmata archaeon]
MPAPGRSRYLRSGYLAPTERVIYETHPSKWFYFWWLSCYLAVVVVIDYLVAARAVRALPLPGAVRATLDLLPTYHWVWLVGPYSLLVVAAGLLSLHCAIRWWRTSWEWWSDTYVVTDDRVIEQKGVVLHTFQEIPIRQIRDVDVHQETVWSRALGYGTVRLKSLGEMEMADSVLNPAEATYARSGGRILPKSAFPKVDDAAIFNPRSEVAKSSGVEWWVGVPDPLRIERAIEQGIRAAERIDAPPPAAPPPS